jgi:hypothetical protein
MDLGAAQSWFRRLSQSDKVIVLLKIMWEFTLIMRDISLSSNDYETRWRLAYHLSEMNHAFTSAASAMIRGQPTFPDDVLMEILLDQSNYPGLQLSCENAMRGIMEHHTGK